MAGSPADATTAELAGPMAGLGREGSSSPVLPHLGSRLDADSGTPLEMEGVSSTPLTPSSLERSLMAALEEGTVATSTQPTHASMSPCTPPPTLTAFVYLAIPNYGSVQRRLKLDKMFTLLF